MSFALGKGMSNRISIRQKPGVQTSIFDIGSRAVSIRVTITSRLNPRQRRTIAIAFFRQLRPFLEDFRFGSVHHFDDSSPDPRRNEERGIFIPAGAEITNETGDLGFKIRMGRLEIGLSQRELADKSGVNCSQISVIERGLSRPHKATIQKLESALGIKLGTPSSCRKPEKPKLAQAIRIGPKPPDRGHTHGS